MGEYQGHRTHVHPVMLNTAFEIAIVKLRARLECGESAAILYALNEGLFFLGDIGKEDHDLLARRYSRKLVDVIAERTARKEDSHTPVLTLEKQKEDHLLQQKDRQFRGMLAQWDQHKDPKWRARAMAEAEKYRDRLKSARSLLALHGKGKNAT